MTGRGGTKMLETLTKMKITKFLAKTRENYQESSYSRVFTKTHASFRRGGRMHKMDRSENLDSTKAGRKVVLKREGRWWTSPIKSGKEGVDY